MLDDTQQVLADSRAQARSHAAVVAGLSPECDEDDSMGVHIGDQVTYNHTSKPKPGVSALGKAAIIAAAAMGGGIGLGIPLALLQNRPDTVINKPGEDTDTRYEFGFIKDGSASDGG